MTVITGKLLDLFVKWQAAVQRRQLAQQTLTGAQAQEIATEAEFKGVAKWLYGDDFTFDFKDGKLVLTSPKGAPAVPAPNGAALVVDLKKLPVEPTFKRKRKR